MRDQRNSTEIPSDGQQNRIGKNVVPFVDDGASDTYRHVDGEVGW
jgi:hypothetical protein